MEHDQTDSDAGGQSSVGVGRVEDLSRKLHETQPNWIADGYGLRGPQAVRQREVAARPEPMQFGLPTDGRASEAGGSKQLTVTDGTTTVESVVKLSFAGTVFEVVDSGNGEAHVQCATP